MTKLLIVDDEHYIRHGLKRTINWTEYGIEIVGEATNGEEALKVAIATQPDIILTDIQMPIMDGIELASKVNQLMPNVRVIFLTAYDSTQNMMGAIDQRVSSFVTKSADSNKILTAVLKAKEELEEIHRRTDSHRNIYAIYNENQYLIESNLLLSLLQGEISSEQFSTKLSQMGNSLPDKDLSLVLIHCAAENDHSAVRVLQNAFKEFITFTFFIEPSCIACLVSQLPGSDNIRTRLIAVWPYVFSSCIAVMREIPSLAALPRCYNALRIALDVCFWNGPDQYTELPPHTLSADFDLTKVYSAERDFLSVLLTKQQDRFIYAYEKYFLDMEHMHVPYQLLLDSITRIIMLHNTVQIDSTPIEPFADSLRAAESPQELKEIVLNLMFPQARKATGSISFAAVYEYLEKNYMLDLKISDVAKHVYCSPGYLSRLFKKETGVSFREYCNRLRIEKSKALILEGKLRHYEVAEQVGYKDYKYFSAYFSKYCGQSPSQFRKEYK